MAAARKVDFTSLACAVLDLELGDGNGTELARALLEKRPALPIAFFTTGTTQSLVEGARSRGPVFIKPDHNPVLLWVKRTTRPSQPPPTK